MSNVKSNGLASNPSEITPNCCKDGDFQINSSLFRLARQGKGESSVFSRKALSASVSTKLVLPIAVLVAVLGNFALIAPGFAQHSASEGNEGGVNRSQPLPSLGINESGLNDPGVTENALGANATVATPTGDRLTVRSGPGASYEIIGSLTNGQTLQLSEVILGNWIQLLGGGWVYLPYLQR